MLNNARMHFVLVSLAFIFMFLLVKAVVWHNPKFRYVVDANGNVVYTKDNRIIGRVPFNKDMLDKIIKNKK